MRTFLRNLHKNSRKGFTLAELMIVIAITGILASFGFIQISEYQKKLKRVELDNIAREIFVAAQNHLTASKTTGAWAAGFYNGGTVAMKTNSTWQQELTYTISDYPSDQTQLSSTHAYYYVIYNSDSYADALTSNTSALTQLLPFGSADETVRTGGSYVIEFDANTQSVYAVFYTDKGSITADDIDSLNSVRGNTSAREKYTLSSRTATEIGYYGGAVGLVNKTDVLQAPVIHLYNDGIDSDGNSEYVLNKNVLEADIIDPNASSLKNKLITVTIMQTSITDGTAAPYAEFTFDPSTKKITSSVNVGNVTALASAVNVTSLGGTSYKYSISLDDITAEYGHFGNLFNTITPGANVSVKAVVSYADNSLKSTASDGKIVNSLFDTASLVNDSNASVTTNTGLYNVSIRTGRHLANLASLVSGYTGTEGTGFKLNGAYLTSSIDWKNYLDAIDKNVTYFDYDGYYEVDGRNFASITNATLKYFNGNGKVLSTFDLASTSGVNGLFSTVNVSGFTVKNLDLVDFSAVATMQSGSLIGKIMNTAVIDNVHVYNSSSDTYGTDIENGKYGVQSYTVSCGGLIGKVDKAKATITNSSASVSVKGFGYTTDGTSTIGASTGGLIGLVQGASTSPTVTIDNCYAGGKVISVNSYGDLDESTANIAGYFAGGFIGYVDTQPTVIKNSYTTASAYSDQFSAGGFVGYVQGDAAGTLSVSNVYAANKVGSDSSYSGLFAGYVYKNSNRLTVSSNSYVLNGISSVSTMEGNNYTYANLSAVYSEDLNGLLTAGTTASASPYLTSLGTSYVYPSTTASVLHHGDWVWAAKPKDAVFKKNIHFTSQLASADEKKALLDQIRQYTSFTVTGTKGGSSTTQTIKLSDAGITYEETTDGYTLTVPLNLDANYTYTVTENNAQEIKDQFISSSSGNYFNTVSQFYYVNKGESTPQGLSGKSTTSISKVKLKNNMTLYLNFDNYYQKYASGTIYYEQYSDKSYQMHGYFDTKEVGSSSNFPVEQSTKVIDDGYIYIIPQTYFDKYSSLEYAEYYMKLYVYNTDNYSWHNWSIATLKNGGDIIDVTDTIGKSLGITNSRAYKLNLNYYDDTWNASLQNKGFSWIRGYSGYGYIGSYALNQFYADTVAISDGTFIGTNRSLNSIVRSASQFKRILDYDGKTVFYNNNGGTVTQQLNIDMTGITYSTASGLWDTIFQGSAFPGTNVYPTVSGLTNTVFNYTSSTAQIRNLNINTVTSGFNDTTGMDAYYGTFLNKNQGTIKNVKFVNCTITNSTFGSPTNRFAGVGLIAYNESSGNITDVTMENTQWTNTNFYGGKIGLIGNSEDRSTLSSLTVTGTKFTNIYAYGEDFGVLGEIYGASSNVTVTNTVLTDVSSDVDYIGVAAHLGSSTNVYTITNTAWQNKAGIKINAAAVGVIGKVEHGSTLNSTTIDNVQWTGLTAATDNFGAIGSIDGSSAALKLTNIHWTGVTVAYASNTEWSYAALIPSISYGQTLTGTTVSNVSMTNMTANVSSVGVIGNIDGTVSDISISQVMINNETGSAAAITSLRCGVFGNVSWGGVLNGFQIKADTAAASPYGFKMDRLSLIAQHWGVIAYNTGTVNGYLKGTTLTAASLIQDISISDVDISKSIRTLSNGGDSFTGGIIGENDRTIKNTVIKKVSISGIKLPADYGSTVSLFGIIGSSSGTLDALTASDYQMSKITIADPAAGTSADMTKYAFIGRNAGSVSNTSISYSASPAGYAVYQVNTGTFAATCKLYIDGVLTPIS